MGRNFQKKRKRLGMKPKEGQADKGDSRDEWRNHKPYKDIVKDNEKYWNFYKAQNLIPEDEWDAFCDALRTDLPVSFRVQGCHKDRDRLMHEMETKFFEPIAKSEDSDVYEPKPLPWLAVTEAEIGHISRQEAVSMIPPLLLNPDSNHLVLDMCAAPGSKTAQLIEMMHENTNSPSGMLIANDVDKKRCYMLIHQTLKRFHTASCVVICEDAARMPVLKGKDDEPLKFDRILCDVICSGDGTLRKNPEIWAKWTPQDALGLHRMQFSIAQRGAMLLKVGGRMVYSTCSMNPIEDEAVVAQLIRKCGGSLRLCDAYPLLPKLKALRGVSTWKVFDRDMNLYEKPEDVPEFLRKMICDSCFSPSEEEAKQLHLEYCMRIVPHHQDTGGFFVALIEKVAESNFDSVTAVGAPAYKKQKMFKDEPFTFLKKDDERWFDIKNHYGIREDFEYENLFSRRLAEHDVNCRQLFYANSSVKNFVQRNMTAVSIQNAGMKMFSRNEQKVEATRFRLSQEGIRHLLPYMDKQLVKIDQDDMLKILKTEETMVPLESLRCKDDVRAQAAGSLVLFTDRADPVCTWVGFHTVAPYVSKEERVHMLRMMGIDCSEIEQMMKSKRKQKAAADRQAAELEKATQASNSASDPADVEREENNTAVLNEHVANGSEDSKA
ncbi:NOL1/NOP2/sun family protein [Ancylostoma ceylanicum]|uniref:NOL1/NOP2/sun family protein n=1 Tax=Ancylostoma ceylanicum TaxID=53326 RepID=A0A0D6LAN2_9BILA|nr:NOL1/NOP2/sun family protein [Ancylostoma ceylanicum]